MSFLSAEVHGPVLENDLSGTPRGDVNIDCLSSPVLPLYDSVNRSSLQAATGTLKLIDRGGDSEQDLHFLWSPELESNLLSPTQICTGCQTAGEEKTLRYLDRRAGESHTAVLWKCSRFPS